MELSELPSVTLTAEQIAQLDQLRQQVEEDTGDRELVLESATIHKVPNGAFLNVCLVRAWLRTRQPGGGETREWLIASDGSVLGEGSAES